MEPKGPKRAPKDPQKPTQKQRGKKTPKRSSKKTCLSVGTGSAFKRGEFAEHGINICANLNGRRERKRVRVRE